MESATLPNESIQQPISQLEHVAIPEWVCLNEAELNRPRHGSEPITNLLLDVQHDIESKASCIRMQQRLENKQAVQELSQWRTSFDPRSQKIQLHHIRVIRDGIIREFAKPENIRIIQREEDLEAYILHGEVTLLAVLEDIRIGDIIESCYTRIHEPQLLPDHFSSFQSPPDGFSTGHYHLSMRFPNGRPIHWKTEDPGTKPQVIDDGAYTRWIWEQREIVPDEPEVNPPGWKLPENWVHVSDMQAWSELSSAAYQAWPNETDFRLPAELDAKIKGQSKQETAETLIRYVQDDFRYLSVKTDLGGQIPNPPKKVIERCYGDCKDLSSLLTHLLRSQSIEARPMLVNHELGKALPELLPCGSLFDHVIVEYQIDGNTYWVDPTFSEQGGGATGRYVPPYHYGLPIQAEASGLVEQPRSRTVEDSYELHDTIMLDTAKNMSILRVTTTATGRYADNFRLQLAHEGDEGFIKSSEHRQEDRYQTDSALEPVKYLDNREENVWQMVELYKIDFFKSMEHNNQFLQLILPHTIVMTAIPVPEERERRCPFAVPNDLNLTHIVEVRSKTNGRQRTERRNFNKEGVLEASVECLYKSEVWTQTSRLKTLSDHLPAEGILSFRKLLSELWQASTWVITAPRGQVRLHRPSNFGELPTTEQGNKAEVQAEAFPTTPAPQVTQHGRKPQRLASHPEEIQRRENEARRHRKRTTRKASQPEKGNGFLKSIAFWKK